MPIELSLRFVSDEKQADARIQLSLFRPDTGVSTRPAPFALPLHDLVLGELRWYLELFSDWPTGPDFVRADEIESKLEDWGRALLRAVTDDREAARLYRSAADALQDIRF